MLMPTTAVSASSNALIGISASDLGTSGSSVQLMIDEYVSPFGTGRLDDFFVSYLLPDSGDFQGVGTDENWSTNWQITEPPMSFGIHDPLEHFVNLLESLTEFTFSLPQDHPEGAPNESLVKAASLFSKERVERFVGHYFRDYCPHSPILHPVTFQASSVSPLLLTVVVVTGALFSSSSNDIELARSILNLVEEYAFSNPVFRKLLLAPAATPRRPDDVESLQALEAAFFITQVQLREGSPSKRKDARNIRFEEIISAVRAAGLLDARNSFFHAEPPSPEGFQWSDYGNNETKIRIVCGVFNLDASFTILYNMIPRLFAEELNIDMPGPVDAFFADNAQDCYQHSLKEHGIQNLRFSELCTAFMQDDWSEQLRSSMQRLSMVNLFALILALLQTLWLSPYRPNKTDTMRRIKLALDRWKQVWDFQNMKLTAKQRERYGFLKTAPLEFWQIATVLVKKNSTRLDTAVTVNQSTVATLNNNQYAHALLETVDKEHI